MKSRSTTEVMEASLDYWQKTHPVPSWNLLAHVLRQMGKERDAEEVSRRYIKGMPMQTTATN